MNTHDGASPEKTLALLWERVKQQGDLPGFAKAVSAILGAMRGEDDQGFNMTQTVLSDPTLTQKVLRLANSAMYSAFGQSIGTVSKAVIVLGTETIGHLALGLKLIDELSAASPDSASAHLEMEKAVLAGHVARHVATSANYRDAEEAVVCSMLHSLGRMMVVFYLADRWALVQAQLLLPAGAALGEDEVATEILHLSLEDIGRATAERWGLPKDLVSSMRQLPPGITGEPVHPSDWLAALSTMSSRCADALCEDEAAGEAEINRLAVGYAQMLGIDTATVIGAVEGAKLAAVADLTAVHTAKRANTEKRSAAAQAADPRIALNQILTRGISDMRDALGSASPSQMMAMALETVYQGLDLKRAIAFLHNHKDAQYVAKMSFGAGVQALIPHLVFDDAYHPDVFKAALSNDKLIFIENAQDPDFAAKLPHWWKSTLATARSFIILPLTLNSHPTAFVYGDWGDAMPTMTLEPAEFKLLNELRALVVQALERRRAAATTPVTLTKQ
jgi:HD-like signal output (HDOD) protein